MQTTIYYVIDIKGEKFYFFTDITKCKQKLSEIAGAEMSFKSFPTKGKDRYYGTVYLQVQWNLKTYAYKITTHKPQKREDYKDYKVVLTPYEEFNKPTNEPEQMSVEDLEATRRMLE